MGSASVPESPANTILVPSATPLFLTNQFVIAVSTGMLVVILVQSFLIANLALAKGRDQQRVSGGELQMRVNLDTVEATRNIDALTRRVDVLTQKAAIYNQVTEANIAN